MPDYMQMYHRLFKAMTESIEILQQAQLDTEEMYVSSKETELYLFKPEEKEENNDDT